MQTDGQEKEGAFEFEVDDDDVGAERCKIVLVQEWPMFLMRPRLIKSGDGQAFEGAEDLRGGADLFETMAAVAGAVNRGPVWSSCDTGAFIG